MSLGLSFTLLSFTLPSTSSWTLSWVLLSITAAFLLAVVHILDKYILTKLVKDPRIPITVLGFVALITAVLLYIKGIVLLDKVNIVLGLTAGAFSVLQLLLYFRAVQLEEISRVVPVYYLNTLFVALLASVLFGEVFGIAQYLGIILIMIGTIILSTKKLKNEIKISKAFWLMLLAGVCLSLNYIITKYLLNYADYWSVFFYTRIGTFLASIPIAVITFKELMNLMKERSKKPLFLMLLTEIIALVSVFFITIAASLGPITLVNALGSTDQFFVLLIATLISVFTPRILREEVSGGLFVMKLLATILVFVGVVLVSSLV